jgi:futalosine hydrolase
VGFGPVAAAARTAEVLARLSPRRVLLLGIAGTYDARRLPVGEAARFDHVAIDGIGAGSGPSRLGPREVGIPQWTREGVEGAESLWEELALDASASGEPARLLTVCSASATLDEARERVERFGAPLAEDMEGFGVALACAMQGTALAIVRGISNRAGERDTRAWKIDAAIEAASALAAALLASDGSWPVPGRGAA